MRHLILNRTLIYRFFAYYILGLCCIQSSAFAAPLQGTVIYVYDGDTFKLRTEQRCTDSSLCSHGQQCYKVRLANIDTPELTQRYGMQAKQALMDMILGEDVTLKQNRKDTYKRILSDVTTPMIDSISYEMVRQGHAWVYRFFTQESDLYHLEHLARISHKGLWSDNKMPATPPWIYRKNNPYTPNH